MNKIFLRLEKGGKNIAKYVIFSVFFVFAFLFGINGEANAAFTDSIFSSLTPSTDNFKNNDKLNDGDGNAITSIDGDLINKCIYTSSQTNVFSYEIKSSSYTGGTYTKNNANCVSYVNDDEQTYYLQGDNSTNSKNTITFAVNGAPKKYKYVAVFEDGYSMSAGEANKDYDVYALQSSGKYAYSREASTTTVTNRPLSDGKIDISGEENNYTLTIIYTLREFDFQEHKVFVYFYDGAHETNNPTSRANLVFTLARPIDTYGKTINTNATASTTCDYAVDNVCILYKPRVDSGVADPGLKTNTFSIRFSNSAAFYFSTVNTHTEVTSITPSQVEKYNSIYATNTFYNEGEDTNPANAIIYHYFNLKDNSTYDYALTTKADKYYDFDLTIDSSGTYTFYLIDIFGNQLTIEDSTKLEIEDISNRTLSIYYIAYKEDGTIQASGVNSYNAALTDTRVTNFELGDDMSVITNDNVTIGLEFYYKVDIEGALGVTNPSNTGQIKMNPLYYDTSDTENNEKQILMTSGSPAQAKTYYCRKESHNSESCVSSGYGSNFTENALNADQTIAATYTGLTAITNNFVFKDGIIPTGSTISATRKKNRVDVTVNENGRFLVRVQDNLGNSTSSTIDISIIDQLQPIITVNGGSELSNKICSSMYVIGGGVGIGSGSTISTYPEGVVSGCATNNAEYNHFEEVTATHINASEAKVVVRKGTLNSNEVDTNGFYNTGTSSVSFNYADAIRMALLRASDSITMYDNSVLGGKSFEKSIYEVKTGNTTYTEYSIYSGSISGAAVVKGNAITTYSSSSRNNLKNDWIIQNNYVQYSSELKNYSNLEFVRFTVYAIDQTNNEDTNGVVCTSDDADSCYDIVNAFIDKTISFKMVFEAVDYAGNVSNGIPVTIDVIDDTTPGIAQTGTNDELITDPTIQANNLKTICRLEIGSNLQTKEELLKCYGLLDNAGEKYNFVDNATTYQFLKTATYATEDYYKNILMSQLYANYNSKIAVYVCTTEGKNSCVNDDDWTAVNGDDITFANAGSYEIKFVISDSGKDYMNNTYTSNTTTIVLCYYVNPRVLLVRPMEASKTYGQASSAIDYCVYATTNTSTFYYNLFDLPNTYDGDIYSFVLKHYETQADGGMVHCTSSIVDTTGAENVSLEKVLATTSADREVNVDDCSEGAVCITGSLSRTYATGNKKYALELSTESTYNAYEDAGYYYITMGDLKIDEEHDQNYVLRLHPAYLLDGETPNPALDNYYKLTDDHYKYDATLNTTSHGETISNVLYTIKQAELVITANGGSKVYGNKDTNYSNAFNGSASSNISQLTYYTDTSLTTSTATISTAGYLKGFTVSGLINSGTAGKFLSDYANDRYTSIILGQLRRASGENVGQYYVCNFNGNIIGNNLSECDIITTAYNSITTVDLSTSNVFKDAAGTEGIASDDDITYGMYVKVGTKYYKLTRNNTNLADKKFDNDLESELWKRSYNESEYSLTIGVNDNNANQNYYITYYDNLYNITPRNLIVQPGSNQGKEYSNPEHNDPIFEIVVFGETTSITASVSGTSFNGYTESIAAIADPRTADPLTYDHDHYQNTDGGKVADSELYFSDRRTTANELNNVTYTYKFDDIELDANDQFTLDGHTYKFASNVICPILNSNTSECIANGEYIGVNKVYIDENGVVSITWVGRLTHQDYELFTSDGVTAGNGYITRGDSTDPNNKNVGWYAYNFVAANLRAVNNSNAHCSVDSNYHYTVGGTGACSNYNVNWSDYAPGVEYTYDAIDTDKITAMEFVTSTTAQLYKHNGVAYCGASSDNPYSLNCKSTSDDVKVIKFSIFKRDIILSFNAYSEIYGNVYNHYKDGIFAIDADEDEVPSILTCYGKHDGDAGKAVYEAVNGTSYMKLTPEQCASADYGLSSDDVWGSNGLNLEFYLNELISSTFNANYYAVPAGLYYVEASIGGSDKVHENYNLVYIDYNILQTTEGSTSKNGALEISSRAVKLVGTYYQKEFGQAVYATYGNTSNDLATSGSVIYGSDDFVQKLDTDKIISIFDNHYYYCVSANEFGCAMDYSDGQTPAHLYSNKGNVYLFTVVDAGNGAMVDLTTDGKVDEIYANFKGAPERARPDNKIDADTYGLLDDVGFYAISLDNVTPVIAVYNGIELTLSNGVISRDENYAISERVDGGLYITPAKIEITVTSGQKKMYGCAYNTRSTSVDGVTYSYAEGYANCIETAAQYYDLGYEYTVKGDKAEYLKSNTTVYSEFNSCSAMENRKTGTCNDIDYSAQTGYSNGYTVTPNFTTTTDGNASSPTNGKPANTSLNSGTMYRIPKNGTDASITYSYKTYFEYARDSQLVNGTKYQDQDIGMYAITLGNLDAAFNGPGDSNKKVQCNGFSTPLSSGGTSECKNFIVYYGENNTVTHSKVSNADTFDSTNVNFTLESYDFEITPRKVVITTEYNYKVYGDTEPNEGYRCSDLQAMFTYPNTSAYYSKAFQTADRGYCTNFISTGVARYYAIDNSLAKAPWTGWIDYDSDASRTQAHHQYNDTLFDVINPTSSKIDRQGVSGGNKNYNDPVGQYKYVYTLNPHTGLSGDNYTIEYLVVNKTEGNLTYSTNATAANNKGGFAKTATGGSGLDRWYTDDNHLCLGSGENADPDSNDCNSYDGTQVYKFVVNDIKYNSENDYRVGDATVSALQPEVYFEIVRREIFIQTTSVTKDYGVEEKYTDFKVELCSAYTSGECTPVSPATKWGVRNSLSRDDYIQFYGSLTGTQLDYAAFKGSDQDSTFRGGVDDRAFGIYFYRTYGETAGSYVIVACATQSANDTQCSSYYSDTDKFSAGVAGDQARLEIENIGQFTSNNPNTTYNASNYIVKTIANVITINQRDLHITPDSGQGFMYGNYETGVKIPPITFTEQYNEDTSKNGLVNGGLIDNTDTVNNQIALCIYDISGIITCINDRQNSSSGTITKCVDTGLHTDFDADAALNAITTTTNAIHHIGVNVYNDKYEEDNDGERLALNRKLGTSEDQRYNRNVGEYIITAGELTSSATYCSTLATRANCLDDNYAIVSFSSTEVKYNITPATIILTPESGQEKTYGYADIEIKFTVETKFILDSANDDLYYCAGALNASCQGTSFVNMDSYDSTTGIVTLLAFAYSENTMKADNSGIETYYNYGVSRQSNKANTAAAVTSEFSVDGANNPKYYDKYCNNGNNCTAYDSSHRYASLTYGSTNRILLGYFYVENWDQSATDARVIKSGIKVAYNEFGNQNYLYKTEYDAADIIAIGASTTVNFRINKLAVDATIVDVTKVYGQATDSHKCDTGVTDCGIDYATLGADDDEGRLEYNFNVTGAGVNTLSNKVLLTLAVDVNGENKYYTQTSLPEYKNIHLGLTVVRAINVTNPAAGWACIQSTDKYGCEDAGEYDLVFRKQSVTNNVDNNYALTFNGASKEISNGATGYAIVNSTEVSKDELNGNAANGEVKYIVYSDSGIDAIPEGQNSDNPATSSSINIIGDYKGKLTINQRNVTFYVGTYNSDGSVNDRYVIEQNEQVPRYPLLNDGFTTSTTTPESKELYYVTWFDNNEYGVADPDDTKTYAPRQVRTADVLVNDDGDSYGVGICTEASNNVRGEVYGSGKCTTIVSYDESNKIDPTSGKYNFDTSGVGDYAIIRDKTATFIYSVDNENRNYIVQDYNGTLVIYADQTAPVIQTPSIPGSNPAKPLTFILEANADSVTSCDSVRNQTQDTFYYNCLVKGKTYKEGSKEIGSIISYITRYYSGYTDGGAVYTGATNAYENIDELPLSLTTLSEDWTYYPVNNIGRVYDPSAQEYTTLYGVDRTVNTYAFSGDVINSKLEAITSIISWFNINSYDYSYVRGEDYLTKRYTPRYYFYINGREETDDMFDPTYVGDFTITIYAVDNVGNRSSIEVTLQIVDTTKPLTSEVHIFNAPVKCVDNPCKTSTIDNKWFVDAGYVSIDAFVKYSKDGENYVVNDTNGTYIKLNGDYVDINGSVIQRYSKKVVSGSTSYEANILGRYVLVTAGATEAKEVEHRYWNNDINKYLVVVGGEDNSYIDSDAVDVNSQWDTYYTIDGTNWYKYDRHSDTGVQLKLKDGVTTIYTRVLDNGRKLDEVDDVEYSYYNDVYLRYIESGDACDGLTNCAEVTGSKDITQVKDAPMTVVEGGYTFKVHSITVTYITADSKAYWEGNEDGTAVNEVSGSLKFTFGIMSCTIDTTTMKVNCETEYKLVYRPNTDDKTFNNTPHYILANDKNIGDWDVEIDVAGGATPSAFYKDRRYIFIDTQAPIITLKGPGYSIYEYDSYCYPAMDTADSICAYSYDEKFMNATDTLKAGGASSVENGTAASDTKLTSSGYSTIVWYTGNGYSVGTTLPSTSGLLENDTLIMSGNASLNTADNTATTFNKNNVELSIYLTVDRYDASGNNVVTNYRFLAIYSGSAYYVYKQSMASGAYPIITKFNDTYLSTHATIESVLEYIVSTSSVDNSDLGGLLTFSINYYLRDAAGNVSSPESNVTVRGITYTKLTSTITPAVANANVMSLRGNNTYEVNVNQGVSLANLLSGFSISNVDAYGKNNVDTLKQSLYYNGEVVFENIGYSSDVLASIDDYASAPGVYTLKVTSTRVVESQGKEFVVDDTPLVIDFVINPAMASVISENDYSITLVPIIAMATIGLFLLSLGYISTRKRKKQ